MEPCSKKPKICWNICNIPNYMEMLENLKIYHVTRRLMKIVYKEHHVLHFINKTSYRVDIIWSKTDQTLNFTELKPFESVCILSHILDKWYTITGESYLLLNNNYILVCESLSYSDCDIDITISVPTCKLRELALNYIQQTIISIESFDSLELPLSLINELKTIRRCETAKKYYSDEPLDMEDLEADPPKIPLIVPCHPKCKDTDTATLL